MKATDPYSAHYGVEETTVLYQRQGETVVLQIKSMSNYELRDLIVGLWARLDRADRADHIKALQYYMTSPGAVLPAVSQAIALSPSMKR